MKHVALLFAFGVASLLAVGTACAYQLNYNYCSFSDDAYSRLDSLYCMDAGIFDGKLIVLAKNVADHPITLLSISEQPEMDSNVLAGCLAIDTNFDGIVEPFTNQIIAPGAKFMITSNCPHTVSASESSYGSDYYRSRITIAVQETPSTQSVYRSSLSITESTSTVPSVTKIRLILPLLAFVLVLICVALNGVRARQEKVTL